MAHGFDSKVGVINFVHKVKNTKGRERNKDENNSWENGSDNFNFLRV